MDVAVTSCLAATASAARARLRLQKDPFGLRQDLDLGRVLARLNGDATPLRRDAILGRSLLVCAATVYACIGLSHAVVTGLRTVPLWALGQAVAGDHLASQPLPPPYDGPHRLYDDEAADPRVAGMPALQAMLFTWFDGNILSTILRAIDRASMAHGIEVRMPFSDWRVSLPSPLFYRRRSGRSDKAMHGLTPEDPAGHKEYNQPNGILESRSSEVMAI
jgi:hypothetical protein